jgi:HEAT repeat protein
VKIRAGFALTAALTAALAQQAARPGHAISELEPLLARIAAYEYGQSREVPAQLTTFIGDSQASPALLHQIEARLLQFLQSNATAAGKDVAFRELSLIATQASVPLLSSMLRRSETAEMARYALSSIPGPAADEALRNALGESSGKVTIGIANSLGQRRVAESVPALGSMAISSDPALAEAALFALGDIGNRSALDALAVARAKISGPLQQRALEAYLQCAGHLARGDKSDALKAYRQLLAPEEPEMIRVAALSGVAATEGKNAIPTLASEIRSASPAVQDAAIRLLAEIPGPQTTDALMRPFPNLAAPGQVRLLAALADRGDTTARPLLVQAAASNTAAVRVAALTGLGRLGDEADITRLAEAAASSQGAEQAAARQSLSGLRGTRVDSAIVQAMGAAKGKVKAELVLAAGDRGNPAAANALIQAVHEPDPDVRRNAIRALRNVAGPEQVPPLLELLKASAPADRRDTTQTLAAVLKRSQAAQIRAAVSAYQAASEVELRLSLLEALGQTSNAEVLPTLREGLKDSRTEIVRGSILSLTDWADAAPLPDLLSVATTSTDSALQVLALRGYLKLVALPAQRPNPESAKLLDDAMRLARQQAEKRSVLSLLPTYPCPESLQVAQQAQTDETVAKEAKVAADRIADSLKRK